MGVKIVTRDFSSHSQECGVLMSFQNKLNFLHTYYFASFTLFVIKYSVKMRNYTLDGPIK